MEFIRVAGSDEPDVRLAHRGPGEPLIAAHPVGGGQRAEITHKAEQQLAVCTMAGALKSLQIKIEGEGHGVVRKKHDL